MDRFVSCVVFSLCLCCVLSQQHNVPEVTLTTLNQKGLRISVPGNNPAVRRVSFHVNINKMFQGRETGQYSADTTQKRNGQWTWVFPHIKVNPGDVIYYWIYVLEVSESQGLISYTSYGSEEVTHSNPHNDPGGPSLISVPLPLTPLCTTTLTSIYPQRRLCRGDVIINENFKTMDKWIYQITVGGEAPEDEFMVFMKEALTSWVDGNKLFIRPSLLELKYNDTFVRTGELKFLTSCTSLNPDQCSKQAKVYLILPPIISARVSTKDKFVFRYGTVEIRAKLPSGKWIVPELWLEPVNGLQTERVVMGLARGNQDDSEFGWRTLEAGVIEQPESSLERTTQLRPWADDFHTFKLHWTPRQMIFYVDNQELHRVSAKQHPIVDKEVYITLGVHVAGTRDFPDIIGGKPWKNSDPKRFVKFWEAKNSWYPSWGDDSALQVEWIKITAL